MAAAPKFRAEPIDSVSKYYPRGLILPNAVPKLGYLVLFFPSSASELRASTVVLTPAFFLRRTGHHDPKIAPSSSSVFPRAPVGTGVQAVPSLPGFSHGTAPNLIIDSPLSPALPDRPGRPHTYPKSGGINALKRPPASPIQGGHPYSVLVKYKNTLSEPKFFSPLNPAIFRPSVVCCFAA